LPASRINQTPKEKKIVVIYNKIDVRAVGILEKKKKRKRLEIIVYGVQRERELLDVNSCSGSADGGNLRTKRKRRKPISIKITVKRLKRKKKRIETNFEPNLGQLFRINQKSPIKHECRLVHACIYLLPIDFLEFFPFRGDDNGFSKFTCFYSGAAYCNLFLN
jgi:hypothetical protein